MTFQRFHNALRVLRSIDRYEFNNAGYALTEREWAQFRDAPYGFFIRANRELAGGIWQIIESRQKPDPAVEVLRRLLADHDPERGVIDAHPDGGCIECVSFTPVPTHLCPYHAAKKIVDAADTRDLIAERQREKADDHAAAMREAYSAPPADTGERG